MPPGDPIVRPGDPASNLCFVVTGCRLSCEYIQWWNEEASECCAQFPWRSKDHVFR